MHLKDNPCNRCDGTFLWMVFAKWYSIIETHVDEKADLVDGSSQLAGVRATRGPGIAFRPLAIDRALRIPVCDYGIHSAYAEWLFHELYVISRP